LIRRNQIVTKGHFWGSTGPLGVERQFHGSRSLEVQHWVAGGADNVPWDE